jgi:hypothetical protein
VVSTVGRGPGAALAFALGWALVACSGDDGGELFVDASRVDDATASPSKSDSGHDDATIPPAADASSSGDDAETTEDASTLLPDASVPDGDVDGSADGSAAASVCSTICQGCCDTLGKCRTGDTTLLCGAAGSACTDCSNQRCAITSEGCCTSAGKCGCSVGGLLECN